MNVDKDMKIIEIYCSIMQPLRDRQCKLLKHVKAINWKGRNVPWSVHRENPVAGRSANGINLACSSRRIRRLTNTFLNKRKSLADRDFVLWNNISLILNLCHFIWNCEVTIFKVIALKPQTGRPLELTQTASRCPGWPKDTYFRKYCYR